MDIGALIAPKPLLICQADRDGLNTIESVRELHNAIHKIYTLYKAPDNIGLDTRWTFLSQNFKGANLFLFYSTPYGKTGFT